MRRVIIVLALFLTSCAGPEIEVSFDPDGGIFNEREKSQFHEIKIDQKDYYFEYPYNAVLISDGVKGYLDYENCRIHFGLNDGLLRSEAELENHTKNSDGFSYEAWYKDDLPVIYSVAVDEFNYRFWAEDFVDGLYNCMDLIDALAQSFSDELRYKNDRYDFGLILPSDFDVEYLNDGVVLTRWFTPDPDAVAHTEEDSAHVDYKVEIVFLPFENFEKYPSVAEYIYKEYPGYNIEFVDYSGFSGYFVDEGSGNEAVRHFFSLSNDGSFIYEAYMRIPSFHYASHKDFFDELVGKMEIY